MIEVQSLSKTYPGNATKAVDGVDFTVETGKLFTLLGPSGCGKTTILRCIAGLEKPDAGTIRLFGECVHSNAPRRFVVPSKRNVGMVFQSYAIWPHMTVLQNVAYPLKGRGLSAKDMERRARDALEMVNLEGMEKRQAPRLSGGQQQRVALARAVASGPRIFLFDEPLSNLDAKLRHEMRIQIRDLQRRLGTTSLYVTHDQLEALSISDHIGVMDSGKIVEVGTPRDIYLRPKSRLAAQFVGQSNIIPATVRGRVSENTIAMDAPFGTLLLEYDRSSELAPGTKIVVLLRPEHINLSVSPNPSNTNEWHGTLVSTEFLGESLDVVVDCAGTRLRVKASAFLELDEGAHVVLSASPKHATVISA